MVTGKRAGRRSFLARVAGGFAGAALLLVRGAPAVAQNARYSGVTDCDAGQGADRPGFGTGVRNRYTDSDTGPSADPRCGGRGPTSGSGSGTQYSDPPTGCSDSDYGVNGDPGGHGRACRGLPSNPNAQRRSNCTDSDTGTNADSIGNGRRCTPR